MSQLVPVGSGKGARDQARQRRVVLSEEEYTSTLEAIVQRDYFPDLPALERQAAVLEKRAVGDIAGAVAVRRAARQLQNHEEASAEKEQEDEHDLLSEGDGQGPKLRKTARPLHRETVSGFHSRVTSEDNYEFDKTQRQEVQARRNRRQEAFQQSNLALRITNNASDEGSETPLLASDKFNPPLNRMVASQWPDTSQQQDSFFFTPGHDTTTKLDGRPSNPLLLTDSHKETGSVPAAALMPPPAPVKQGMHDDSFSSSSLVVAGGDQHKDLQQGKSVPSKQSLVEYVPKHAMEKRIEPSQTRFPSNPASSALVHRKRALEGDDTSHTEYSTDGTSLSTDLDESTSLTLSQERKARVKRQRRDQEALVAMTPLLVPGKAAGGEGRSSPIITWGTVASTPLVLGGMDTATDVVEPKPFTMPERDAREDAARRAESILESAKQNRSANKPKKKRGTMASAMLDQRTASLTPAALSLLKKNSTLRPVSSSSARSHGTFASALRSSYTPQVTKSSRSSMKSDHALKATPRNPRSKGTDPNRTPGPSHGNITDGLLKLPK